MKPTDDDRWLSAADAARRLGVTTRTLYRLIDIGALTAYRVARPIRLRERDVASFLESRRLLPGSLRHLYPSAHE
jgi:excisionase family DNA binding protein